MKFSITAKGALVDSSRRESRAFDGLTAGVKAQRAFTLIELLVVIAIIAILAAIMLPVLDKAKQRAVTAQCLNNMKQLQTAYRMYVDDNNDWLPWNGVGGSPGGVNSWITNNDAQSTVIYQGIRNGVLYQYNQSITLYNCPANLRKLPTPGSQVLEARKETGYPGILAGSPLPQTRTCSINYPLGGYTASSTGAGALLATGVHAINKYTKMITPNPTPPQMIVFCDENKYSVDDGDFAMYPAGSGQNEWWNMPGSRHQNGTTWSFADGHCEYWRWHGGVVPAGENSYPGPYTPADSSDDLARVQACTCPLGN
jgi:prepilin-type N-terminal cleavage/methylation domain-containing protein/prepilin-type processing-associated H-X9-DG protein